jgi:hypothetical protein
MSESIVRTHPYITGLPTSVSQRITFVEKFTAELEAGYIEPETTAISLKAMEELVKALRANPRIRDIMADAVNKHPEKTFEYQGAKFEKAETGVSYDYTVCQSSVWKRLKEESDKAIQALKNQEEFLKSLAFTEEDVFDNDTGEKLFPPAKSSNTYFKVTLKK